MSGFVIPFLLVVLALGLLIAEDLLPTAGALGILAACVLGGLLYLGFAQSSTTGLLYLGWEVATGPAGLLAWMALLSRTGIGRFAHLRPPEAHEVAPSIGGLDLLGLVGRRGRALTPLRPSGMVEFEGRRIDAVAGSGLIEAGLAVEAVGVRSGRLVVLPSTGADLPGLT